MHLRRLISVLSVVVVASGVVAAQPKKADKKKKAPAAEKGSAAGKAAGSGSAATPPAGGSATGPAAGSAAGSAAAEEGPPKDIEGREENPDNPKVGLEEPPPPPSEKKGPTGYPIEEAQRPITLYKNMVEVSIGPHARVDPFYITDALRARYGITPTVQIGLTYAYVGLWSRYDIDTALSKKYQFHPGKAIGPDVTFMLAPFVGIRVGVPIYISPFTMSLAIGAPMKFHITDKVAIGGLDDLLNVQLGIGAGFAPSFYSEFQNAKAAYLDTTMTAQSRGTLRFSGYAIYQHQPKIALIGRVAIEVDDFSVNRNASGHGGAFTSIRAGVQYALRPFLDLGGSIGFEDLSKLGSFAPALYLAARM